MSLSLPEFVTRWKASALSERAADDPTSPICVKSSAILILLLRASLGADLIQCEKVESADFPICSIMNVHQVTVLDLIWFLA
ncbi:MAG TPA: hypothetical protein VII95_10185 [Terriglobales bacterium]|jgi:hypothetical protein